MFFNPEYEMDLYILLADIRRHMGDKKGALKTLEDVYSIYPNESQAGVDVVNGSSTGIATSGNGTKRKCYRRLATSAFGRLTDIRSVVRHFRY